MNLLSHVRGDSDLLHAWFEHYRRLGVTAFHLIVHGPRAENAEVYRHGARYQVTVCEEYDSEFLSEEKARRLNRVLATLPEEWTFVVDSDEFLELPYRDVADTIRALDRVGATALYAPFLHHVAADSSLAAPEVIHEPFRVLPLCSIGLHHEMGVEASGAKYPLFRKSPGTILDAGNHLPPNGPETKLSSAQGVTHHFKWRRSTLERLARRANSSHTWRHESAGFLAYLRAHEYRLPTDDAFPYSRSELFRRGLLRRTGAADYVRLVSKGLTPFLPAPVRRGVQRLGRLAVNSGLVRRIGG